MYSNTTAPDSGPLRRSGPKYDFTVSIQESTNHRPEGPHDGPPTADTASRLASTLAELPVYRAFDLADALLSIAINGGTATIEPHQGHYLHLTRVES